MTAYEAFNPTHGFNVLGLTNLITHQARREGGCDGCARTPPQTAEVHFFVKKINSKKKNNSVVLFVLF